MTVVPPTTYENEWNDQVMRSILDWTWRTEEKKKNEDQEVAVLYQQTFKKVPQKDNVPFVTNLASARAQRTKVDTQNTWYVIQNRWRTDKFFIRKSMPYNSITVRINHH